VGFRASTSILVVALVGLVAARVEAQAAGSASQPSAATTAAGYEAAIDQALSEYQAHDFEEALAFFTKAHTLSPNARTLRGMAMAEYELRRYVASLTHLQEALASRVMPIKGALRTETEELLRKAQQYVSRVVVQVAPATANARITVDGAATVLPADGALLLQVGERVVEVQAEGFEPERHTLVLQAGGEQQLTITLRPNSARVVVDIQPANAGATVSVDGTAVVLPADGALLLRAGERILEAQAQGFERDRRTLLVQGGVDQKLSVVLRPIEAPKRALLEGPAPARSVWKSPWLWTGVGAVVAGGVVVALLATQSGGTTTAANYQGNVGTLQGPGK
jgi:hypothetical protein